MPYPFPVSRQLFLSFFVPGKSLGNQAKGTDIVLPSLKSTLSVSSVTVTFSATGTSASTVEIRISCILQCAPITCVASCSPHPALPQGKRVSCQRLFHQPANEYA